MEDDAIFKAASGFGGGVGMLGDTCGALVGAGMMLSLKYGRSRDELESMEKAKRYWAFQLNHEKEELKRHLIYYDEEKIQGVRGDIKLYWSASCVCVYFKN